MSIYSVYSGHLHFYYICSLQLLPPAEAEDDRTDSGDEEDEGRAVSPAFSEIRNAWTSMMPDRN